jgi:hypothetical protein
LEHPKLAHLATTFPVPGSNRVEDVRFDPALERVSINTTQYFGNVPATAWGTFVGGYQAAEKWLKSRKDRTLTYNDIQHYQRMIVALQEMSRLMIAVDGVVSSHGGWPFAVSAPASSVVKAAVNTVPPRAELKDAVPGKEMYVLGPIVIAHGEGRPVTKRGSRKPRARRS